jgi:ribosomal-protein-alanine N-acetyltransferase
MKPIETPRLRLRAFALADAPDVFAYASDPLVSRYTSWPTHQSVADSVAFIEWVLDHPTGKHTWAICRACDPRVIGAIAFGLTASAGEARIDYALARPHWNQGLMSEAARAVLAWGFHQYPTVGRVISCAVARNTASRRVMEKCGFTFERMTRHQWPRMTEPVEMSEYALTRVNLPRG